MAIEIDWPNIDDVMLDMDGTLLDLHFDNHFWLEYVPIKYAEDNDISIEESKAKLMEQYKAIEGTLNWYCLDHWSQKLELDIALLKEEIDHLIAVHPYVVDFLEAIKEAGKRTILVTNAHQKALALKMKKTRLDHHFDEIITSHQIGHPKETQEFWTGLQSSLPFDPDRTLFVDDSLSVLKSARKYGIAHLIAVLKPDTRSPAKQLDGFNGVENFKDLLPALQN